MSNSNNKLFDTSYVCMLEVKRVVDTVDANLKVTTDCTEDNQTKVLMFGGGMSFHLGWME